MDAFLKAYIVAALWSTNGDNDEPLDANHSETDLAPETLAQMKLDCEKFQKENAEDLACRPADDGGHDFWLTRNHHGAGFWDGDWPKEIGERLTAASAKYGEFCLYIGDDKKIYA
jgi:hypothetical protein